MRVIAISDLTGPTPTLEKHHWRFRKCFLI
jgi:hypothetical protein